VIVLQPLYENDRHYAPGETLTTTEERGRRLAELGLASFDTSPEFVATIRAKVEAPQTTSAPKVSEGLSTLNTGRFLVK
jgi:hypothetical protein